jgi:hypothetical protein
MLHEPSGLLLPMSCLIGGRTGGKKVELFYWHFADAGKHNPWFYVRNIRKPTALRIKRNDTFGSNLHLDCICASCRPKKSFTLAPFMFPNCAVYLRSPFFLSLFHSLPFITIDSRGALGSSVTAGNSLKLCYKLYSGRVSCDAVRFHK